jgi:hypothetical protein
MRVPAKRRFPPQKNCAVQAETGGFGLIPACIYAYSAFFFQVNAEPSFPVGPISFFETGPFCRFLRSFPSVDSLYQQFLIMVSNLSLQGGDMPAGFCPAGGIIRQVEPDVA